MNLRDTLGYTFSEVSLLEQALTHRSLKASSYERLEFLGDAVLALVIGEYLFTTFPEWDEGCLSRVRANLVKGETLAILARELKLMDVLKLGRSELRSGGVNRDSILADLVEAILGAVYLDGGLVAVRRVVLRLFSGRLAALDLNATGKDPKTELQEWAQQRKLPLPVYDLLNQVGEAHALQFTVCCRVADHRASATASSRKKAERAAATQILAKI